MSHERVFLNKFYNLLFFQGSPALSPPSFVPKAAVQDSDGEFLSSWDTSSSPDKKSDDLSDDSLSNIIDDDDEKDDDDDDNLSLPPGVMIVSTLPDDLSKDEGDAEKTKERDLILNSINTGTKIIDLVDVLLWMSFY